MKLTLNAEQFSALKSFLTTFEDCEALSDKEYVLDLYDLEPPLSLDIVLGAYCLIRGRRGTAAI